MTSNGLEINTINGVQKVKNPLTGRFIKIGSALFKKLVRTNIIDSGDFEENNVIYKGLDAEKVLNRLNKGALNIPKGKVVYATNGKIMTRNKRVTKEEIRQKTQEIGMQIYQENPSRFVGLSVQQTRELINQLVSQKLVDPNFKESKVVKDMNYVIDHIDPDTSEDEYEDEDGTGYDGESDNDEDYSKGSESDEGDEGEEYTDEYTDDEKLETISEDVKNLKI